MRDRRVGIVRTRPNRQVLGSVGAGLVGQAAVVLSGPLVARQLGPEDRGELALMTAAIIIACEGVSVGTTNAIAYLIPLHHADGRTVLRQHARTIAVAMVLTGGASAAAAAVVVGPAPALTSVAFLAGASYLAMRLATAWAQGEQWFGLLNRARPIPALVYAGGALCLYLLGIGSLAGLLTFQVLGNLACIGLLGVVARGLPPAGTGSLPLSTLVRFGRRSLVGTASPLDSLAVDQVAVGARLGSTELGYYAVGGSFANLPTFVLQSMGVVVGPRAASTSDPAARRRLVLRWSARAVLVAAAIVSVVQAVLAPAVVLLFGAEFEPSVPIARILVLAGGLLALRKFLTAMLLGTGSSAGPAWGEVAALATFAAVFAALARPLGLEGAAWAMVAAGASACVTMGVLLHRRLSPIPNEVP